MLRAGYCESELAGAFAAAPPRSLAGLLLLLRVLQLLLRRILMRMLMLLLTFGKMLLLKLVRVMPMKLKRVCGRAASLFGCWRQPLAGATPLLIASPRRATLHTGSPFRYWPTPPDCAALKKSRHGERININLPLQ